MSNLFPAEDRGNWNTQFDIVTLKKNNNNNNRKDNNTVEQTSRALCLQSSITILLPCNHASTQWTKKKENKKFRVGDQVSQFNYGEAWSSWKCLESLSFGPKMSVDILINLKAKAFLIIWLAPRAGKMS